ncbi:MAG: hypothetical protein ACLFSQ_08740, partial [Candidatus Zixiibacteriota bacterium]
MLIYLTKMGNRKRCPYTIQIIPKDIIPNRSATPCGYPKNRDVNYSYDKKRGNRKGCPYTIQIIPKDIIPNRSA